MSLTYADPELLSRVLALYDTTWPGLAANIRRASELGWRWDAVSTPFVVERDGALVAHVGVLEYDILLRGRRTRIAGVHAVCTDPRHRGAGHARSALHAAMAHIDSRGVPAVLATEVPQVYTGHGFATVSEQRWRLTGRFGGGETRPLVADHPADIALLERLHRGRAPLSDTLSSLAPSWMLGICSVLNWGGLGGLHYAPALDAVLAWELDGDEVVLLDVVASILPTLDQVLDHLPVTSAVTFAMHVDGFGAGEVTDRGGAEIPAPSDDLWMVRGLDVPGGGQMPLLARH